ncbi:MAG: 5' nucleotidase, deoxy (Pyrimidine), cytosolic type C protein (NT5C) [Syntrophorhabdus sp. PtaU1.Bin153]|nr:MAG: 5' nucleotidase, deoxy (Pyrimidine), cytosolic type C protein (NT5C) [Syntrophorhabdus sp. PtaU1.Bin153]
MKKIAVDIDNTLWDFSPVFWEKLREINPAIVPPAIWNKWEFWETYVTKKQLYTAIKEIHLQQDCYLPFDGARTFLASLREKGFYIIIASHRAPETRAVTAKWLEKHDLVYDELHLSNDKSIIFKDLCAVVDDSPIVLDRARAAGVIRVGLRRPWNKGTDHPLFESLEEILAYLDHACETPGTGHGS